MMRKLFTGLLLLAVAFSGCTLSTSNAQIFCVLKRTGRAPGSMRRYPTQSFFHPVPVRSWHMALHPAA